MIVEPVRDALEYYRRLNEAAKDEQRMHRKSIIQADFSTIEHNRETASVPSSPVHPSTNNDIIKSHSGANVRKASICLSQVSVYYSNVPFGLWAHYPMQEFQSHL